MAVSSQLELDVGLAQQVPASAPPGAQPSAPPASPEPHRKPKERLLDIRSLKEEKVPANAQQMIAVAGYYLQEVEGDGKGDDTFTANDMNKLFKQAGFPLPKSMAQTLINTRNAGYLDETSTRGAYKLSRVGYNLVTHSMPKKKG